MNERLKSVLGLPEAKVDSYSELIDKSTAYFDLIVDFLREENKFPNREINKLLSLTWRLVGNKHVPVTFDTEGKLESLSFTFLKDEAEETAFFIMPRHFIQLVDEDPLMQIGAVVYNASQVRDYWTGKLKEEIQRELPEQFRVRAWAYEAEALLTMEKLLEGSGEKLLLNEYQYKVLGMYPNGLSDLHPSLYYETPGFLFTGIG